MPFIVGTDLATERERHLTTGKLAETTKLDFRCSISHSAIGQASYLICARRRQLTFPFCCILKLSRVALGTRMVLLLSISLIIWGGSLFKPLVYILTLSHHHSQPHQVPLFKISYHGAYSARVWSWLYSRNASTWLRLWVISFL